jgi:Tol biopolymer transport system component
LEATQFNESEAQVSPDGRWIVYVSDETGKYQVYARPFPGPGGRVPISIEAGVSPRWSGNGREVLYLDPANSQLMAVDIEAGSSSPLRPGQPHALFRQASGDWDVTADGKRLLVKTLPQTEESKANLELIVNWFEELRRKVPPPAR